MTKGLNPKYVKLLCDTVEKYRNIDVIYNSTDLTIDGRGTDEEKLTSAFTGKRKYETLLLDKYVDQIGQESDLLLCDGGKKKRKHSHKKLNVQKRCKLVH